MDVPRSDGTNGEGEDGEDGDGTVVVKCKEDVWHGSEDNGDVTKKMCKGRDPSLWCSVRQFVQQGAPNQGEGGPDPGYPAGNLTCLVLGWVQFYIIFSG